MSSLRRCMSALKADQLYMAVATDDLIEAVNIPLRARHGTFGVDYTGHTPALHVTAKGCQPELLATVDTRRRKTYFVRLKQQPLALMFEDIERRLATQGAGLAFFTEQDRQGRRIAKLQIHSTESRRIALWLAKVPQKTRQGCIGPFRITDPTTTTEQAA